ncbi:MAG: DUF3788 domain-containing protein [Solirubrobacterales bacterium]
MDWKSVYPETDKPGIEQIGKYVDNPLWQEFNDNMMNLLGLKPLIQYSKCSMVPGWNVKYKKSGRALCTLYPMENYFICLVVIGGKEAIEAEIAIDSCNPYIQGLYNDARPYNGGKWLMVDIKNKEIMDDVNKLISLKIK